MAFHRHDGRLLRAVEHAPAGRQQVVIASDLYNLQRGVAEFLELELFFPSSKLLAVITPITKTVKL